MFLAAVINFSLDTARQALGKNAKTTATKKTTVILVKTITEMESVTLLGRRYWPFKSQEEFTCLNDK